ncbi:unnamed protein product [Effrenium voratum]|uniref:Clp R domain-containing protein n=2 Tax=Effrenium voratum TaxID=2562239 RepID=A0AA36I747_9DINO|nr:unnamed protein product [Effrenium voratum]
MAMWAPSAGPWGPRLAAPRATRARPSEKPRGGALSGLLPAGLAAAAAMRSRLARRISRSDPLAGVPESAWPLLQRAEEADASFGWQQIAAGLDGWRRALEGGQVWEEASWPMASLRQMWTETLRDLDLPRLTRRYPELIDPLLFRLLEISVQLSEAMGDAAEDAKAQGGGQDKSRDDAQGDGDTADQQSNGQQGKHPDAQQINQEQSEDPNTQPAGETLAQELMDEFRQDWEPAVDALNEAEEAFGLGCARSLAEHFAGDGGRWRRSQGWRAARKLRKLLAKLPDLRKLVLRIGRRAAVKGRRRWLPREEEDMSTAWGVARSRQAQTETSGLARSGSLELMLPAEAHLLVHGRRRPALRALHHARRLEQSLVSYDRNSWQQLPTRELNSEEVRPAGENGPLILCLDTSGSMARKGGAPETVAKALVFECLRQAQQQKRRCCLFAFSTGEELKQMELDLTGDGLEGLLDFLSFAFHGGTSLNEVLTASVERLHRAQWQNADLLVVTDGEVPKPEASVLAELQEAKDLIGARVYGVVVGSQPGAVMVDLCSELYHFKRRGQSDPSESLDSKTWALRRVNVAMAAAFVAGERSRGAFAGQTLPSPRTCRTARYADGREAKYQIWDKRERQRRLEREKELESKMGKRFQWVGGRWLTKEESEAQSAKIETVYQESRLGDANLQLELKKHFQSRFLSPYPLRDVPQDVVAAQWAEETLGRFEDQLLSLLVRASREASRLGQRRFEPEAALLGLFRCPVGKEICRQGLGDCEDVTERCRQLLERCIRRSADSGAFDLEDLPFSPELRRLLEAVEAERARLQHEEAQVAHLALALTSPKFRPSWQALAELGVEPQALRPAALANLGGALAAAEAHAEAWLWDLCADVGPQPRRRPLKGLQVAYTTVSRGLVERSVEAKLLLLAALSGEHLFLLGSPGTAKSLLARRLSKVCEGSFFERLLTRFTVPEELFGPLSLSALEQDELRRKTKGYLPECDVAFIDEIFKANSSILNALLVILNERRFDNGDQRVEVPLWCAVAASNELPDTDELDALYDRFLLRRKVARISKRSVPDFLRQTLDQDSVGSSLEVGSGALLTIEDSWDLQRQAQAVDFPEELLEIIAELREFLAEESEPRFEVSDRRLARAARLLRIAAAAAGGKVVVEADLLLLRHMFWDRDPEQGQLVTEWLLRRLGDAGAGKKAWPFLLEGLQTRLRHGLKGPGLDAARRDLRSLQQAAARAMLRLAQIAHDAPSEVAEGPDRFFWLGEKERRQACELGRRCQEESQRLQDVLRETSVLIQLASVEDEQQREELLCRRLGMERATQKKEVRYDEWGDEI